MSELSPSSAALWQGPLGWLGISLICGSCLFFFYQRTPLRYRPILCNARWIVIPYLGLLTGGISPRLMGLTGINWFASFGFGLVLIGGVLVVLIIVRSVTAFPVANAPVAHAPAEAAGSQNYLTPRTAAALPVSLVAIGAEEFHWAFLRSALWEIFLAFPLLAPQAGYWAAWMAVLLALPEALRYQTSFSQRICKCALLVTTTVLFLFTRNLWLSWLLHVLGWTLLAPASKDEKSPSSTHTRRT